MAALQEGDEVAQGGRVFGESNKCFQAVYEVGTAGERQRPVAVFLPQELPGVEGEGGRSGVGVVRPDIGADQDGLPIRVHGVGVHIHPVERRRRELVPRPAWVISQRSSLANERIISDTPHLSFLERIIFSCNPN